MTALLIATWFLCAFVTAVFVTMQDWRQSEARAYLVFVVCLIGWPFIAVSNIGAIVLWLANIGRRK